MGERLEQIRALVGAISEEQIRFVDCFVAERVALFLPSVGPCYYAVTPDHTHPAYSFVLAFDDRGCIAAPRGIIRPRPGQLLAMDPGAVHHEILDGEHSRYVAIFVEGELLERERARYPGAAPLPFDFRLCAPGPELPGLLKEFMTECENRLPGHEILLEAIGLRIVHSLLRAVLGIRPAPGQHGHRLAVGRVIEYMHAQFGQPLSAATLADRAALSPSHFSRLFRRETGLSPMAYLHRLRLDKARQLLRAGDHNITEVALACGFANPSHFAESFRRTFGQPPRAYRESLR